MTSKTFVKPSERGLLASGTVAETFPALGASSFPFNAVVKVYEPGYEDLHSELLEGLRWALDVFRTVNEQGHGQLVLSSTIKQFHDLVAKAEGL